MRTLKSLIGLVLAALLLCASSWVLAAPDPDATGSLPTASVEAYDFAEFAEQYLDVTEEALKEVDLDTLKVPHLVPDEGFFAEVNELIRQSVIDMIGAFEDPNNFYMMSSYEVIELDDVISIRHRMQDMVAMSHDHTYVLDLQNEELLDNVQIAELYGIDEDEVESFILQTLYDASILQGERVLQVDSQFNLSSLFPGQTLNYYYSHPESAELFIDKNGDLALSAYVFIPAGSGFTQMSHRVQFTAHEPSRFNPAFFKLEQFADLDDYTFDKLPAFVAETAEGFPEDEDFAEIAYNLSLIDQCLNNNYETVPPVLREYTPYGLDGSLEDLDTDKLNETFVCIVPPDRFTVLQLWDMKNDIAYTMDPCVGTCFIALSDFDDVSDEPFKDIGLRVTSADGDEIYALHDPDGDSPIQFVETDVDRMLLNLPSETESVVYSDFADEYEAILKEYDFDDLIAKPEERYYNLPRFASDNGDFGTVNEELDALAEDLLEAVDKACAQEVKDGTEGAFLVPSIHYTVYEDEDTVSLYLYIFHPEFEREVFRIYTLDKNDERLMTDDEILELFGQDPEDRLPILAFSIIDFGNQVGRAFGSEEGFVNYANHVMAVSLNDLYNSYDPEHTYFYLAENGDLSVHIPPKDEGALMTFTMIPAYYELLASDLDNTQFLLLSVLLDFDYDSTDLIVCDIGSFNYDDYDPEGPNDIFTDVNVLEAFRGTEMALDVRRSILAAVDPDSEDMNMNAEGEYYLVIAKRMESVLAYVPGDSSLDPATDLEELHNMNSVGWFGTGITQALFIQNDADPDAYLFWRCGDEMADIHFDDLPDNVYDMTDDLADFPDTGDFYDSALEEFIRAALMKG